MNGLLDYMAEVDVDYHDEIDSPAVGYGNELLWEATKSGTPATAPTAKKRQARKSGDSNGTE